MKFIRIARFIDYGKSFFLLAISLCIKSICAHCAHIYYSILSLPRKIQIKCVIFFIQSIFTVDFHSPLCVGMNDWGFFSFFLFEYHSFVMPSKNIGIIMNFSETFPEVFTVRIYIYSDVGVMSWEGTYMHQRLYLEFDRFFFILFPFSLV